MDLQTELLGALESGAVLLLVHERREDQGGVDFEQVCPAVCVYVCLCVYRWIDR